MTDMPTISASKLKTFSACRRKYYYTYIRKEQQLRHPAAAMGTCVHKAVEMFHREGQADPSITYQQTWLQEMKDHEELLSDGRVAKAQKEGLQILDLYDWGRRPREVELEFTLPYPDPIIPICYVRGYIDQIYDDASLVDMKTSRNKPLNGVLAYDPQFILYNWAYLNLYGEPASKVIWRHLRTNDDIIADVAGEAKFESVLRVVEELLFFQQQAEGKEEAELENLFAQRVNEGCLFCGHRKVCLGTEK